jgi:quercetin dioxygenase-like cupin family protein
MHKGDSFAHAENLPWEDAAPGVQRKVLCYDDGIMMVHFRFQAGAVGALHTHPHVQCSLIEDGAFDVTIAGKTERLVKGDSYLVPPNALHGATAVEAGAIVDVFTPMREDFVRE